MNHSYKVIYVGDDSLEHSKLYWAKDHDAAIDKARAGGLEEIVGVRRAYFVTKWILWLAAAVAAVLLYSNVQ